MLLTAMFIATTVDTASSPVPASVTAPPKSQRSIEHPLSQTTLQPILITPCADSGPGCRHADFFDFRASGANHRLEINADLDYVNSAGLIGLFPGESVAVKLDPTSGKLSVQTGGAAPLGAPPSSPTTAGPLEQDLIRIIFTQSADGNSYLSVRNGFSQQLEYHAQMRLPNGSVQPTDVCQVLPGIFDFETWPYPIIQIVLGQMKTLAPTGKVLCQ